MTSGNEELKKIFDECCTDVAEGVARHIKFTYTVGKDKKANQLECRQFLGYYDEDEKKDLLEAQNFRNKVLHPLRNHLSRRILSLRPEEVEKLWSRDAKSPEDKKNREKILALLPKQVRRSKEEIDIGEIIGDI